jgi:hypothetical protein
MGLCPIPAIGVDHVPMPDLLKLEVFRNSTLRGLNLRLEKLKNLAAINANDMVMMPRIEELIDNLPSCVRQGLLENRSIAKNLDRSVSRRSSDARMNSNSLH